MIELQAEINFFGRGILFMDKKLRYGLIGAGVFGSIHMANLAVMECCEVKAICDKHIESAEKFAEKIRCWRCVQ